MSPGPRREAWPLWVKVALWGISTRDLAWVFVWLSLAVALAMVAGAAISGDRRFLIGAIMVAAGLWYYFAIRWVDRHDSWS